MHKCFQIPTTVKYIFIFFWVLATFMVSIPETHAVRIKDIADIKGVRSNQLVGYGLVVGLEG
ncbi:MAG: flagellar basal body P-ring protein FlgI, partial [Desulfobacterales bacterium]